MEEAIETARVALSAEALPQLFALVRDAGRCGESDAAGTENDGTEDGGTEKGDPENGGDWNDTGDGAEETVERWWELVAYGIKLPGGSAVTVTREGRSYGNWQSPYRAASCFQAQLVWLSAVDG